ncbi:MAG: PEP-CTERM sorting domain-containing protein [Azoarcus sp.]|nr:PEP-CTERM sorting domain-containing protein [Azoarcus sp.]
MHGYIESSDVRQYPPCATVACRIVTLVTTWIFMAPVFVLDLGGGSIAYHMTSVPEPQAWAMLLAGLAVLGTMARQRAGG